jgi:hypothetical protein
MNFERVSGGFHLSPEFQEQLGLFGALRARLLKGIDQAPHTREAGGENFALRRHLRARIVD